MRRTLKYERCIILYESSPFNCSRYRKEQRFPLTNLSLLCHRLWRRGKAMFACRKRRLEKTNISHSRHQFTFLETCVPYDSSSPSNFHFQMYIRCYMTCIVSVCCENPSEPTRCLYGRKTLTFWMGKTTREFICAMYRLGTL